MIWRDDDVLWQDYGLNQLFAVDDLLKSYGQRHTVAVLADTLTDEVAAALLERKMDVQLHAWHHDDLSVDEAAIAQLPQAIARIEACIGQKPTVLYPPWNRVSDRLKTAAKELGLRVSHEKISLGYYLRMNGNVPDYSVVNFHYWADECAMLPEALALYTSRHRAA
jgi:peptidoglycan/xylan/chitin deacetylase (PgdA/CDA1 family)